MTRCALSADNQPSSTPARQSPSPTPDPVDDADPIIRQQLDDLDSWRPQHHKRWGGEGTGEGVGWGGGRGQMQLSDAGMCYAGKCASC